MQESLSEEENKREKIEKIIGKIFQNKFKECTKYNFLDNNLVKFNKIIDQQYQILFLMNLFIILMIPKEIF